MTNENIMPGAEPFFFAGNDIGVLVSHGFTGTPQSMRYLGEQIHAAGYTVMGPRLAGHGVSPAAMAKTGAADWIASIEEAMNQLRQTCKQIYMVGLSMGGTLTLYTAAKHPGVIQGAVTINAVVRVGSPGMAAVAYDRTAPDTVPGIGSDIKAPDVEELAYKEVPVTAFREAYALAAVTHDLLPTIACPALVITAREDHVVDPTNGPLIAQRLGSSRIELSWLDDSYHVATLDNDKLRIAQQVVAFIRSIAGQ
ncbi:carboxylesterase [Hydrogenophaga palleronii]|uniref:Carboxylesterase n=1 Tax=Hydrogenophaga palleronii TaxID=65655 RepID=A0ABU1WJE0_9BURK|nr:alpha/beta fold hydrolase [Hydrogenophaga palleronii]MDR7149404.1 carboxylesterase [Hydrogenophaga palleronii]